MTALRLLRQRLLKSNRQRVSKAVAQQLPPLPHSVLLWSNKIVFFSPRLMLTNASPLPVLYLSSLLTGKKDKKGKASAKAEDDPELMALMAELEAPKPQAAAAGKGKKGKKGQKPKEGEEDLDALLAQFGAAPAAAAPEKPEAADAASAAEKPAEEDGGEDGVEGGERSGIEGCRLFRRPLASFIHKTPPLLLLSGEAASGKELTAAQKKRLKKKQKEKEGKAEGEGEEGAEAEPASKKDKKGGKPVKESAGACVFDGGSILGTMGCL